MFNWDGDVPIILRKAKNGVLVGGFKKERRNLMELETQLSIQALIDGELSDEKQVDIERLVKADSEAQALFNELSNTAGALKDGELEHKLPETREFFWSKISAEIEREERQAEVAQTRPGAVAWWKRLLVPVGSAAALVIAFTLFQPAAPEVAKTDADVDPVSPAVTETLAETELEMPESFTFYMFDQNATVIWVDSDVEVK